MEPRKKIIPIWCPDASDKLVRRLYPVIRRVARRYSRDEDHADDLAQDCLVRAAVKLPRYRDDTGSIEAWASNVADNRCKSLLRADPFPPRGVDDEHHEIPDPAPPPDERLERKLRSDAVRAAVAGLPERERAAIRLVYLDGLSYREAARRMRIGVKAVQSSVYRGIHMLKGIRDLAAWRESFCEKPTPAMRRRGVDEGEHPVLALVSEPGARDRIRAGASFGGIDRLFDGVRFAVGWRDLRSLAGRLPGCPVVVDPACPGARGTGIDELKDLRARLPGCPIIGYRIGESRCGKPVHDEIGFVSVLHSGVDDDPDSVRVALLRAADRNETELLLDRMRHLVNGAVHSLLEGVLTGSLTRCSVAGLAEAMGLTSRTLSRTCRTHGLPTPKRLLSLATIYHVERLARWSGQRRGPIALALGFSDTANYARLVKRTLGATSTEVARRGGSEHVARVMLREMAARS